MGRILIVDDDAGVRELLETVLTLEDHHTVAVSSGAEALRLLRDEPFDLVLLDIWLPDLCGYDLLEAVRATPRCGELPVIIISGASDRDGSIRGARSGALDHVPKPFDPSHLVDVVARALAAPSGTRFVHQMRARGADLYASMLALYDSARLEVTR